MILPYQEIRIRCLTSRLIQPYSERTVFKGMTYGAGPAGYDVRIAEDIMFYRDGLGYSKFSLASTIEHFNMPDDLLAQVCDKSSWARKGIFVQNTVIEPGWRGYLTLEITSQLADDNFQKIEAGSPIAQIVFMRLTEPTEKPYGGKYQDQQAGPQRARDEV